MLTSLRLISCLARCEGLPQERLSLDEAAVSVDRASLF